jgi:hypothetical protein
MPSYHPAGRRLRGPHQGCDRQAEGGPLPLVVGANDRHHPTRCGKVWTLAAELFAGRRWIPATRLRRFRLPTLTMLLSHPEFHPPMCLECFLSGLDEFDIARYNGTCVNSSTLAFHRSSVNLGRASSKGRSNKPRSVAPTSLLSTSLATVVIVLPFLVLGISYERFAQTNRDAIRDSESTDAEGGARGGGAETTGMLATSLLHA